ncbi:uncharacterized protein RSE6_02802 [Rhynchosporium secalis]|uniref:Uncharacterized protein n=1 Tax=Rhynchosporium secalis TaxID=38038 RepID=A0A1E1M159_RHYSE|nr:uncharacterized protein RSE6_02802 [Rhynchosporium secalis]
MVITCAVNVAFASHQASTSKVLRTPFPTPAEDEDIERASPRNGPSFLRENVIYLTVVFGDPSAVIAPRTVRFYFPIDWDIAFYHSWRIAEFYRSRNGHSPNTTVPVPLKICFSATSHLLANPIPDEQTLLVDLWIVADDLEIFKLQNLALNELDLVRRRTSSLESESCNTFTQTPQEVHNAESANRAMADQKLYPPDFMIECTALITKIGIGEAVEFASTLDGFMVVERKDDWKA